MVEGSDKLAENQPSPGQNPAIEHAAAQAYTPKDISADQHARSARVRTDEQNVNEVMRQSQQGATADSQAVGQQIVSKISPETAAAYVHGQQLQASGRSLTDQSLSHDDREALSTYHNLHSQMENDNGSYTGSRSLTQIVEDGIKSKQTQYERQSTSSTSDATVRSSESRSDGGTRDRSSSGEKPDQQSQTQSTPAWLVKGQENNRLFGDDPRASQKPSKGGDGQTADHLSSDQRQRVTPADASVHDGTGRVANRTGTDQNNQLNQNARDVQQSRQTDASRQPDQLQSPRRADLKLPDDQRQPNQGQINRNADQRSDSTAQQQRTATRDSDVRQSGTMVPRDLANRNSELQTQQQLSGKVAPQDTRAGGGNKISATEDQRTVSNRDNSRGGPQTADKQSVAERSSAQARQAVSGDTISQQRDSRRQTEQPGTAERKGQDVPGTSDRRTLSNPVAAGKESPQQATAREVPRVAVNDAGQSRTAGSLSDRTISLLRQSTVEAHSIQLAIKGTVIDTRAADIKSLASGAGGASAASLRTSLEITRQIRTDTPVSPLTLRATQAVVRAPDSGRPLVQTGRAADGRAVAPARTGDARPGAATDAGARPGVIAPGTRAPGSISSGLETARTFTTTTRIIERSPDRRYILGTEIALAAVIAAAGAARQRADATASGGAAPEAKGGPRPTDIKAADPRAPNIRTNDAAAARTTDARTGASRPADGRPITPAQRPDSPGLPADRRAVPEGKRVGRNDAPGDKRFITGAEIALAAVIASAGTSRARSEKTPDTKANQDTARGQKNDARPGEPGKQDTKPGKPETSPDKPETKTGKRDTSPDKPEIKGGKHDISPGKQETNLGIPPKLPEENTEHREIAADQVGSTDTLTVSPETGSRQGLHSLPQLTIQSEEVDFGKVEKTEDKAARAEDDFNEQLVQGSSGPSGGARLFQRPTVLIATNETLVTIAEAYFHDPNLAWLIADLNKEHITESWIDGKRVVELKSRQQLSLPVWDDITEFYENRPLESQPENVITIVQQTQVDVELLNSRLGVAMGVPSAAQPNMVPAFQSQQLAPAAPLSQRSPFSRFLSRPRIADG